ncbi:hypothetical protein Cgig2_011876 [Carnegiea gigantea]|uniref:Uncharacterized protein n=1 Tax=Carnegiea gigantea TaxID=171969 RepID=A0A9Q1K990_9CARY|nr:hypothetical protein Cgig2_011876 [Carnegiea gigantea]
MMIEALIYSRSTITVAEEAQKPKSAMDRGEEKLGRVKSKAAQALMLGHTPFFPFLSFSCLSDGLGCLLEQMVEALCRHVSDESATIPSIHIKRYTTQVLGVILALLDDLDETVQLTAVSCLLVVTPLILLSEVANEHLYRIRILIILLQVLDSSPSEAVEPILLNLSVRIRNLQVSMNTKMRTMAIAAFGALCRFAVGTHIEAFLEQVPPRHPMHPFPVLIVLRHCCAHGLDVVIL